MMRAGGGSISRITVRILNVHLAWPAWNSWIRVDQTVGWVGEVMRSEFKDVRIRDVMLLKQ